MSRYIVLIPDNEETWEASSEEAKQQMYALHASSPSCSRSAATR